MTRDGRGSSLHVATVAHTGRLWEVYVEFDDDPERADQCRARVRFDAPDDASDGGSYRTAVIIIEDSIEEALARARALDNRHLKGLLRSVLPDAGE